MTDYTNAQNVAEVRLVNDQEGRLPSPVIKSGEIPFDQKAWLARQAKRTNDALPTSQAIRDAENAEINETSWLEWYLKSTEHLPVANADLRALVIAKGKGKKILPGTPEQHETYTSEFDMKENGHLIRQFRQRAIFGMWADGSKTGPALPSMSVDQLKWMASQATEGKYLKWWRGVDPVAYHEWLETHPNYRTQNAPLILTVHSSGNATL